MKILVCERDFLARSELLRTLEAFGDCSAATSGEETLFAVVAACESELPFDLITLDLRLQAPDGSALLTALRAAELGSSTAPRARVWLRSRPDGVPTEPGLVEMADGALPTQFSTEALARQMTDCGLLVPEDL